MKKTCSSLEESLGYVFQNQALLATALIHRSYRYENEGTPGDNQRLEFLGDAVLGLVVAEYLFDRFDAVQEGTLTQLRSALINTITLSAVAARMDLGRFLLLGHGEQKSGGAERISNLADGLESVIGAMYLDGGIPPVLQFFERYFLDELQRVLEAPEAENPKGALQEYAQKHGQLMPEYVLVDESGPPHCRQFEYELHLGDQVLGRGTASSKQQAQTLAAMEALEQLLQKKGLGFICGQ